MDTALKNITFFRELQQDLLMVTEADIAVECADKSEVGSSNEIDYPILLGELNKELKVLWTLYHKICMTVEAAQKAFSCCEGDEVVSPALYAELERYTRKKQDLSAIVYLCFDREFHPESVKVPRRYLVSGFDLRETIELEPDFADTLPG